MKIIFDSEEQKEKFISEVSTFICPSDINFNDTNLCDHWGSDTCKDCWRHCGIEMEVKENV